MRDVKPNVLALLALCFGVALLAKVLHADDEARALFGVATGLLVGLPLEWRRSRSSPPSEPPGPSFIPVAIAIAAATFATACGSQSTRGPVCTVARAAVEAAREVVEDRCPMDAGVPQ